MSDPVLSERKKKETIAEETVKNSCNEDASACECTEETQQEEGTQQIDFTAQLQVKLKEQEEKYLRLAAEYDNFKKRTTREKDSLYTDAVASTMAQVLPVFDNLERAACLQAEGDEAKKVLEGVALIAKQFAELLVSMGVEPIEAVGNPFDHCLHNAVMHIEDESCGENVVLEELLKGYMYKDKVIRYSMVKVAN